MPDDTQMRPENLSTPGKACSRTSTPSRNDWSDKNQDRRSAGGGISLQAKRTTGVRSMDVAVDWLPLNSGKIGFANEVFTSPHGPALERQGDELRAAPTRFPKARTISD